ncbi:alpha/beta hydrolase [Stenotrophomonas sp. MMGLT7]|uniref:alpha/beta fold hydrolase n=1 Tax=Stenotrophomonas sp. MMGLT7 TaxID=2901227 RepID=UPI001E31DC9C|nr:alpha/beta hydrolase [Stenotrophomonas sp. MMGLT7]MCD7099160.1 alpha/beta hydrolase [Stenotrophomonas sp. MMGLT7]
MADDRIPLLLLPGLLNDAELWRDQLAGLADIADCQVGDLTGSDTLRGVAEQVLAAAPPRFALAGFSMGGYVAQDLLRIAPARVERLALLGTSVRAESPERSAQRRAQARAVRLPGEFHGFGEIHTRSYIDPSRYGDHALIERIRAMTVRLGAPVFQRQSQFVRPSGMDVLTGYDRPLLLVCGEHDRIAPLELHLEMQRLVPQARLLVLPDCGHMAPMERPQEVTQALRDWLLA